MQELYQLLIYADNGENIPPALFEPGDSFDNLNVILGKERDLSFNNIMRVMKKIKDGYYPLKLLNCEDIEELAEVFRILNIDRWADTNSSDSYIEQRIIDLELTEEQANKLRESEKKIDLFADFDAYYWDFKTYLNVDLLMDNVHFTLFLWGLGAITSKEESLLSCRIKARTFKYKPKEHSKEYAKAMMDQKRLYSFGEIDDKNLDILLEGGTTIGKRSTSNIKN